MEPCGRVREMEATIPCAPGKGKIRKTVILSPQGIQLKLPSNGQASELPGTTPEEWHSLQWVISALHPSGRQALGDFGSSCCQIMVKLHLKPRDHMRFYCFGLDEPIWGSDFQRWPLTPVLDASLMLGFPACFLNQEYVPTLSMGKHLRHFFSWNWTSRPGAPNSMARPCSAWFPASQLWHRIVVSAWHCTQDNQPWHRVEGVWFNTAFFALAQNSVAYNARMYCSFEATLELSCVCCVTCGKTALNFPVWDVKSWQVTISLAKITTNAHNNRHKFLLV